MTEGTIAFELVSPEKRLRDEPAVMVVIPGVDGDIGVLAEHSPVVTTIRPGVISIYANDDKEVTDRLFLAGGFADITGDRVTVLAEEAWAVSDLDKQEIENEQAELTKALEGDNTAVEKERLEKRLNVLEQKLIAIAA